MLKSVLLSFAVLALSAPVMAAPAAAPATAPVAVKIVEMKSLSFEPKKVSVHVGESIEWKNVALTPHSATADDGKSFDTGIIEPKKTSKPVKFETAGTFQYHCTVHGKVMSGTVEVTK